MVENKIPFPNLEPDVSDDERVWAMVCHLSCLFGGILVPALIYFVRGRSSRFVAFHSKQALVYHSTVFLVLIFTFGVLLFLAPLFLLIGVIWAFKARNGEWLTYPVIGDFVSKESPS